MGFSVKLVDAPQHNVTIRRSIRQLYVLEDTIWTPRLCNVKSR